MKNILKNKQFLAVYLAWALIHTILLVQGIHSQWARQEFWPITSTELGSYDLSEWLAYVCGPSVILLLISAFNDKSIKIILIIFFCRGVSYAQENILPVQPIDITEQRLQQDIANLSNYSTSGPMTFPTPTSKKSKKNSRDQVIQEYKSTHPDPVLEGFKRLDSMAAHATNSLGHNENNSVTQEQSTPSTPISEVPIQSETKTFDWKASNADRFVNSPCFKQLGFDPAMDFSLQEKRYQECEHEKQMETVKRVAIIGAVVLCIISLIYMGTRKKISS